MIDSFLWTCFIWYLFATAGYHLDTLLDTLEEGRHSFLDFSTFPDLLKSSNPSLSAKYAPLMRGYLVERVSVYETGQRILECGGIPVYDMTQEAIVTKLMWVLGQTRKYEQIRWLFGTNLAGEVTI